jgi:diphthamide biosynthesis protein 7
MQTTTELCSWDTELSADAVEWCPAEGFQHLLLVGTYQVDANDKDSFDASQRRGRLILLQVHIEGESSPAQEKLTVRQSLDTQAILDIKWCPHKLLGRVVVASVDAKGSLELYALDEERLVLTLVQSAKGAGEGDALALSLDWNDSAPAQIVVSDSKGRIHLVQLDSALQVISSFEAHDFEAWVTCFDAFDANLVYSGGDDSLLKFFDLRQPSLPSRVIRGKHEAGVTSLKSSGKKPFRLFSGRYVLS